MKVKSFIYTALLLFSLSSCGDNEMIKELPTNSELSEAITADAIEGELLIKFSPAMTEILDDCFATRAVGGVATRSGIPSTDEVLTILRLRRSVRYAWRDSSHMLESSKSVPARPACTCGTRSVSMKMLTLPQQWSNSPNLAKFQKCSVTSAFIA